MIITVATSNAGKLRDFQGAAAAFGVEVRGLSGFAGLQPPVEDGATFAENARKKAAYYSLAAAGELVIADDSGLEVEALGGAPGVHSARYAAQGSGGNASDEANNRKLLAEMQGVADRRAQFVCVIAAARSGVCVPEVFTGAARGSILTAPRGSGGFGYDPLFWLPQLDRTFAELGPEEKARYSHRGAAFRRFMEQLTAQHFDR
ncbi:MAG: RdgB/HAM1 family non-canonical purine NTP pyrophosphatase [Acidobacteria bacterium]|nr:RdgB/HAM1 family non-canonical purine NTP pyrophosphatase [Acidobacteriota bacterium]